MRKTLIVSAPPEGPVFPGKEAAGAGLSAPGPGGARVPTPGRAGQPPGRRATHNPGSQTI